MNSIVGCDTSLEYMDAWLDVESKLSEVNSRKKGLEINANSRDGSQQLTGLLIKNQEKPTDANKK